MIPLQVEKFVGRHGHVAQKSTAAWAQFKIYTTRLGRQWIYEFFIRFPLPSFSREWVGRENFFGWGEQFALGPIAYIAESDHTSYLHLKRD
jgi:hypothetical protein